MVEAPKVGDKVDVLCPKDSSLNHASWDYGWEVVEVDKMGAVALVVKNWQGAYAPKPQPHYRKVLIDFLRPAQEMVVHPSGREKYEKNGAWSPILGDEWASGETYYDPNELQRGQDLPEPGAGVMFKVPHVLPEKWAFGLVVKKTKACVKILWEDAQEITRRRDQFIVVSSPE